MIIKSVKSETVYYVETDEEEFYQYTRHGKDSWCVTMGESEEPISNSELEALFQRWLLNETGDCDRRTPKEG